MKKDLVILMAYLLIFASIFGLSIFDFMQNKSMFDLGISTRIVNLMIILLSSLAVVKTSWHIYSY